jgi:phosphopantothenoylcysteine decarboxylase / phosphopantothenate---cysteine ligase
MNGWLKRRRIAIGVGGGIAAYKACELTRELVRAGAEVRIAMTHAAQQFVTPLTFQSLSGNAVLTDYFEPTQEAKFGHLDLARWAEVYVVAPATADLLARIRAGMANDPVTTRVSRADRAGAGDEHGDVGEPADAGKPGASAQ